MNINNKEKINLIICGIYGRFAKSFLDYIKDKNVFNIIGGISFRNNYVGDIFYKSRNIYISKLENIIKNNIDKKIILLDFSHYSNIVDNLKIAYKNKISVIYFQTINESNIINIMKYYSKMIPILIVSNCSYGANVLFFLCNIINNIWKNIDISCLDIHHKNKKEIFSSTLKDIINNKNVNKNNICSFRVNNVLGVHQVFFYSEHEELIISHRVNNVNAFNEGILKSIYFIYKKKNGFFYYKDIFNKK